jgi:hypothetical protein
MSTEIIPRSSDWYVALAEECHAIVVEKTKIAQQELTEMYLMLGARILEEAKHAPITRLVEAVSQDIHIGKANLWYAVAVVKKYGDDVNKLPIEGAMISWNKTKKLLGTALPEGIEDVAEKFDPYGFTGKFFATHTVKQCQTVATELLRLIRERK